MGRPTKLTAEVQDTICTALRLGATMEIAARYGGVSYDTFNNWRKRGQAVLETLHAYNEARAMWRARQQAARSSVDEEPPERPSLRGETRYVQFFEATEEAIAESAMGWLQVIFNAGKTDPQWAAWMLVRRFPDQYAAQTTQKIEHTGRDGGPIETLTAQVHIYIPDNGRGDGDREPEAWPERADGRKQP